MDLNAIFLDDLAQKGLDSEKGEHEFEASAKYVLQHDGDRVRRPRMHVVMTHRQVLGHHKHQHQSRSFTHFLSLVDRQRLVHALIHPVHRCVHQGRNGFWCLNHALVEEDFGVGGDVEIREQVEEVGSDDLQQARCMLSMRLPAQQQNNHFFAQLRVVGVPKKVRQRLQGHGLKDERHQGWRGRMTNEQIEDDTMVGGGRRGHESKEARV